nr:MAG TPA: hypothetical protein [Caudoviricetes sp.]
MWQTHSHTFCDHMADVRNIVCLIVADIQTSKAVVDFRYGPLQVVGGNQNPFLENREFLTVSTDLRNDLIKAFWCHAFTPFSDRSETSRL